MRLFASHEVNIAHGMARIARKRRRPDQAGRAVSEKVDRLHLCKIVDMRKDREGARSAPSIARLVEVKAYAFACDIDDVRNAGSVDVGKADAPLIELVGAVEPGRGVHRDLLAEAAITKVRP